MSVIPSGFCEASVEINVPGDAGPAYVITGHDFGANVNPQVIADKLAVIWAASDTLRGNMSNSSSIERVIVRANYGGPDLFIGEAAIGVTGSSSGSATPPNVAFLYQKLSGLAGRTNRGRLYMPGVPEGAVDGDGFLTAAALSNNQGLADTFLSKLAADDLVLHILHTSAAITPTEVNSLVAATKVATQRRRLR